MTPQGSGQSLATERRRPWAVLDREGTPRRVSMGWNEHDAWKDFLSWPTRERIEQAKAKGFRAVPVEIVEVVNAQGD